MTRDRRNEGGSHEKRCFESVKRNLKKKRTKLINEGRDVELSDCLSKEKTLDGPIRVERTSRP